MFVCAEQTISILHQRGFGITAVYAPANASPLLYKANCVLGSGEKGFSKSGSSISVPPAKRVLDIANK